MKHKMIVENTPNPNAKKFILDAPVISQNEKKTYRSSKECDSNEIASALFNIASVSALHFFENVITVTMEDNADTELIKTTILDHIDHHDPNFFLKEKSSSSKEKSLPDQALKKINTILGRTIRPSLLMDGGDLSVVEYKDNILYIHYEGACGGCPSAQMGTLQAIQDILRSEYHPDIEVVPV